VVAYIVDVINFFTLNVLESWIRKLDENLEETFNIKYSE
jgi:hypothetical protein